MKTVSLLNLALLGLLLSSNACVALPSVDLVMPVHTEGCGGHDTEAFLIGMKEPDLAVFAVAASPIRDSTTCNPHISITTSDGKRLTASNLKDIGDYATFTVRAQPPPREVWTHIHQQLQPGAVVHINKQECVVHTISLNVIDIKSSKPIPLGGIVQVDQTIAGLVVAQGPPVKAIRTNEFVKFAKAQKLFPHLGTPPPIKTAESKPIVQPPPKRAASEGFVLIRKGSFRMGSPRHEPGRYTDELMLEDATVEHDFIIQTAETTQREWQSVMGTLPSFFKACGGDCPIERTNWFEAVSYANKRSQSEGFPVCYTLNNCKARAGAGEGSKATEKLWCESAEIVGPRCLGYRLPTEREWEYAARAGSREALYTGPIRIITEFRAPALDNIAWYAGNSMVAYPGADPCPDGSKRRCGIHPVRQKKPNQWGLYDVLGNVWEWTETIELYGKNKSIHYLLKGGSWYFQPHSVRLAKRRRLLPRARLYGVGFRLVRTIP